MKNFYSLLKGKLATTVLDRAPDFFRAVHGFTLGDNSFPSEALSAFKGSVNNSDNWGKFGTEVAKVAIDYLTTPRTEVNAALPPTTGTIVNSAPALPLEDVSVSIPVRRPVVRGPRLAIRKPIRRRARVVPTKTTPERTVAKLLEPKRKPRKRIYKTAL